MSAPGTYTVTVTNESNGCTAVTSTTVIENNTIPAASATNNGPLTCIVPNVTMTEPSEWCDLPMEQRRSDDTLRSR